MLTPIQAQVFEFLRGYQREHGIPPSTRQIQTHFGFGSQNAAVCHLRALAKKNAVVQLPNGSWAASLPKDDGFMKIPVFGTIPAGLPQSRDQEPEEAILVHPSAFGVRPNRYDRLWALRILGDSMIDAHICSGDIGIFEQREAKPGDIIAALVDGSSVTLKRLIRHGQEMRLRAEKQAFPQHTLKPTDQLEAQGVLVGLVRRSFSSCT